jgi:hypothetical protein
MKKFTINCDFNGQKSPFTVFIGNPQEGHHPLQHQADWLSKERGGTIPSEVMESISKLQDLAKKNSVSLEDLCIYALGSAEQENSNNTEDNSEEADSDDEENSSDDKENIDTN